MPASIHARARAALIVLATLGLTLVAASPSQAEVIQREKVSFPANFETEVCGFTVREVGVFSATAHVRVGKGDADSAFFSHANFHYAYTITNVDNGRFFTTEGRGVFNEIKAERIGDTNQFVFTAVEAGQTFVLRDPSGDALLRDRGNARSRVVFDTLGDATPGGTFVEYLGEKLSGRHPGATFDDEGRYCDVVTELLG